MREDSIIEKVRDILLNSLPSSVDVRTDGGDSAPQPPEVILGWSNFRLNEEQGHTAYAETLYNDSDVAMSKEYHMYFRMEVDCTIRYFDAITRDIMIDKIQSAFLPFESDSDAFHRDTAEWEVGGGRRNTNTFVENDWYEGGVLLSFKYVKRTQEPGGDTIEAINVDVEPDESIEDSSSEIQ